MPDDLWTRRDAIAGIVGSAACAVLPPAIPARAATAADLSFTVYRDGSEIGWHKVRFVPGEGHLEVDVSIQFDVTFALIPLYRYRHRNREMWQEDRLLGLEATTNDDGTEHWVRAKAEDTRLIVESSSGRLDLPGTVGSTSYWNEAVVQTGTWVDTQSGQLVESLVEARRPEEVRSGGKTVLAIPYVLAGDIDCELWYHEGRWVKLRFQAPDGSTIDYVS